MNERLIRTRPVRPRAAAVAVCSLILAAFGATLVAAPADASTITTGGSDACATTTTLLGADGTGAADLGARGLSLDLLHCGVSAVLGQPAPARAGVPTVQRASSAGTTTPSTDAATAAVVISDAPAATGGAAPIDASSPTTTTTTTSAASAGSSHLTLIDLDRSSPSVYPVKDGYRDSVKFAIHALNAAGEMIPVEGTAVLTTAGSTVKSWTLDGSRTVLTWDGRVDHTIRTGVYTLAVTAWSPDGSVQTEQSKVRVLAKHVEKKAVVVRSNVGAKSISATMPKQLIKYFAKGQVAIRLRTVAKVSGPAKLVFTNGGVKRTVALKNGVRTSKSFVVPEGFERVTITHDWAAGAATLKSFTAVWSYYKLV